VKEDAVLRLNLPVTLWLTAAFVSFVASVAAWFLADRLTGIFIGLWVPSILSLASLLSPLSRPVRAEGERSVSRQSTQ
jgi:hypothetical protein